MLSVGHAWACPKSTTALFPGIGFLASLPESKAKRYKHCVIQCVIAIVSGRTQSVSSSMGPRVWYWGKKEVAGQGCFLVTAAPDFLRNQRSSN